MPETEEIHPLELQRREKRDRVAALGLDVYGGRVDDIVPLADAIDRYDEGADEANQASVAAAKEARKADPEGAAPAVVDDRPVVRVAGRVVLHRDNGKLVWMNLRDPSRETFQVAVSKRECDEIGFEIAKAADLGDVVVAEGPLMRTKAGEITCWATSIRPGAKCLVPPPEKRAGLADVESRYRKRYLDLWSNPDTARVFELRSLIVGAMRRRLEAAGFMEVETPMLQPQAGGAAARPFRTHMNALGIDLFMRIAPELYLKRLLVGGFPRVFEINRNFRNEGVDKQHNPEFTMLELYQAFGDYHTVMAITEDIVRESARLACEKRAGEDGVDAEALIIRFGDVDVRYAEPFDRVTYRELFERALGFPMNDTDRVLAEAKSRGFKTTSEDGGALDPLLVVNELFEEVAEASIDPGRPTWIMDYPAALSPLTKPSASDPTVAERADLFIGHMEIGPHYTELNDPDLQAEKFREQLAGLDDEETTFRNFDRDFIEALKTGMPPAGGMGMGIDRLTMLMTGQRTIRDVVLFPMMRPLEGRSDGATATPAETAGGQGDAE